MAKKFLTGVVLVCAIAMISTCAFAAISDASGTYNSSTGEVTVTCTTDATTSSVSLMGLSTDYTSGSIAASQITCLDQQDEVASSEVTFTCTVDTATFDTTKVYLGGTGITTKIPVTFETVEDGGDDVELVFTTNTDVTSPFGQTDGKILRFSGLDSTKVVQLTDGDTVYTSKTYTTTDGELIHIIALPYATDVPQSVLELVDGTPAAMVFGDANGDGSATAADTTYLSRCLSGAVVRGQTFALPTDLTTLTTADVNGDGSVTAADTTMLGRSLSGAVVRGQTFSLGTMGAYTIK